MKTKRFLSTDTAHPDPTDTPTVYDVTRPDTFENLSKWLEEVETYHPGRGREVRELASVRVGECARVRVLLCAAWHRFSKGYVFFFPCTSSVSLRVNMEGQMLRLHLEGEGGNAPFRRRRWRKSLRTKRRTRGGQQQRPAGVVRSDPRRALADERIPNGPRGRTFVSETSNQPTNRISPTSFCRCW